MATLGATTVTSLKASGALESTTSLKAPEIYLGTKEVKTVFATKSYEKTIDDHIGTITGNPHKVTKADVGLGSVRNVEQYSKTETDDKLDTKINIDKGVATTSLSIKDATTGAVSLKFIREGSGANDWTITDTGGYLYIYSDANGTTKPAVTIDPSEANSFRTTLSALTVDTVKFEDKITNPSGASNGKILKIAGGVPTWGTDNDHQYLGGTYLTLADDGKTFNHDKSGVTAGNYGLSSKASPVFGGTFSVPYITLDSYGHATSASSYTVTIPSAVATDQVAGLMSATDKKVYGSPTATMGAVFYDV